MNTNTLSVSAALSTGWEAFKRQAVPLMLIVLVAVVIVSVLNCIPVLGQLAGLAISGMLLLGMWTGAFAALDSKTVSLEMLFSKKESWLMSALASLLVSIVSSIPLLIAGGLAMMFGVGGALLGGKMGGAAGYGAIAAAAGIFIVGALLTVVLYLLLGFWPGIVLSRQMGEIESVGESFRMAKSQCVPLLILSVACWLIGLAGLCLCLIGIIPAVALIICVMAAAYRQMAGAGSVVASSVPPAMPNAPGGVAASAVAAPDAPAPSSGGKGGMLGVIAVILVVVLLGVGGIGWAAWKKFGQVKSNMVASQEKEGGITGIETVDKIMMGALNETVAGLSPDLELVKINPKTGKLQLRYKPTGETISVDPEKLHEEAMVFLEKVSKVATAVTEAAPVAAPEPEKAATPTTEAAPTAAPDMMEMAELKSAPDWVPAYSGWVITEQSHQKVMGVLTGTTTFTSSDKIEKMLAFFEEKLKASGLTVDIQKEQEGEVISSAAITALSSDSKKVVNVTFSMGEAGTEGTLVYTQSP